MINYSKINILVALWKRWGKLKETRWGISIERAPKLKCPNCGRRLQVYIFEVPHGECGSDECYMPHSVRCRCPECGFEYELERLWEW